MAVGANLSYADHATVGRRILNLMKFKRGVMVWPAGKICSKAGAPATNTAADNPIALYDLCLDATNNKVYICTAYTANASGTTWTQIVL